MNSIFKKSIELNMKISKFLDIISNSLSLFEKEIKYYLDGEYDSFKATSTRISELETEADKLETDIKTTLYKYLLLPDTRADVLSLIKSMDNIIDATEEITKDFCIQQPKFPETLHESIIDLTTSSTQSAEELLLAARSFFGEVHLVSAYINKVNFFEHEVDLLEDKINDTIFNGSIIDDLAIKLQLKYFISKIASIADEAEFIGEKLAIFTIKREI